MLKRKLLMTVLPLLTAGVLVGSGFSSWSFSESNTKATNPLGVTIKDMTSNNYSIALNYSNLTLVLDQGGSSNKDDVTKGIYFATTNDTNTAVTTLTASKNGTATDGTNFDSVKFSITIAEAYRPYLKIANDATGRTSDYEATTTVSLSSNVAVIFMPIKNDETFATTCFFSEISGIVCCVVVSKGSICCLFSTVLYNMYLLFILFTVH